MIILLILILIITVVSLVLILALIKRDGGGDTRLITDKLATYERNLKDEFERSRKETLAANSVSRQETTRSLLGFQDTVSSKLDALTKASQDSFLKQKDSMTEGMVNLMGTLQTSLKHIQESNEKKLE